MKEHPIIFSSEMVRAILEGRKTQTRRIVKHLGNCVHIDKLLCDWPLSINPCKWDGKKKLWRWIGKKPPKVGDWVWELQSDVDDTIATPVDCPYGQVGDRLWLREAFEICEPRILLEIKYKADGGIKLFGKQDISWPIKMQFGKHPSIHMPKWAARIFLEITNIRVERVQDISEEDAKAEGIYGHEEQFGNHFNLQTIYAAFPEKGGGFSTAREAFELLWDSLNAKRGYGWDKNPWVWVIEFRRISKES